MRLRDKVQLKNIPTNKIKPKDTTEVFESELQESLIEIEQKKPIEVIPIGNDEYLTMDGGRRLLALKDAGVDSVLCEVWYDIDDKEYSIRLLVGNSGKPNPMEEAIHMAKLQSDYGMTLEDIGKLCNYSPARVCQTIKLVYDLVPELQQKVKSGDMKISAAQIACKLSKSEQRHLASNNDKILLKTVSEVLNQKQSEQFILPDDFGEESEVKPGLFLSYEQMEYIMTGFGIEINWEGKRFMLGILDNELKADLMV